MRGIYLHIPFCERKCSYCDFYSIESTQFMQTFVGTLEQELRMRSRPDGGPAETVFFGGGTPSLLAPAQLERLVEAVHRSYRVADDAEWTMECNPGTVSVAKLEAYRRAGINRLSFGVQSFQAEELAFLQRIHSADDAVAAMAMARAAGFENVNMDLMFALPPQTMARLQDNVERLLALEPDHVSAYSLIYEPGTPLYTQFRNGSVKAHAEEDDAAMYAWVMARLAAAGFEQYEVSNFARAGRRCRHNLLYWHGEDYVAVGPSAHGLLDEERYWNLRSLTAWTAKVNAGLLPQANTERLSSQERLTELAFLHLRADGLPVRLFADRFGLDLRTALQPHLDHWIEAGMIADDGTVLRLTAAGYHVCDDITVTMVDRLERASRHSTRTPSATDIRIARRDG